MLLQELKLHNIRSYTDARLIFPEGSTVLLGDIGCGKSSLLLAIEFALFGTSRPDLPGELLLRKGTNEGFAELKFQQNNSEIIIKRNLKKDQNGIKQTSGYIIQNGVKKELTAVELKSEALNLLGYPNDLVSKNKNYIFRYTVYTPQEEMKFILQENSEERLDVLRKIFNVDKYKNIRENVQIYLKKMRTDIAIAKTKIEPLPETLEQQKNLLQEITDKELMVKDLEPQLKLAQDNLAGEKKTIGLLEAEQKKFNDLQQKEKMTLALFKEKEKQQQGLQRKENNLEEEIKSLLLPKISLESLQNEIYQIEWKKKEFLEKRTSLQQRIRHLQESIAKEQKELNNSSEKITQIDEKEKLKQELEKKIGQKKGLEEKKKQLSELFKKTNEIITKNNTILEQAQKTLKKINLLNECPTCLQKVSDKHKEEMQEKEGQKIRQSEILLFESSKKRSEISEQIEKTEKFWEEILRSENLWTRTKVELIQLKEIKEVLEEKKTQFKSLAQENNFVTEQLQVLESNSSLGELDNNLREKRETLSLFSKKDLLTRQQEETSQQIKENELQLILLQKEKEEIQQVLFSKQDNTCILNKKKEGLQAIQEQEKILAIKETQLKTQMAGLVKQEEQIRTQVEKLKEEEVKLKTDKEIYHWLEAYFLKLTAIIEKQVMVNIHGLFNQFFQEWFDILIEDEEIYAKIDSSFSPVIEQNGYEILFQNLSGGEKTSAALAYRLALNRVINDVIHEIKTKDILILDEPTDGFSSEQLDKVRDVLDRLNLRQTIIVSHENKIESFVENVIRVEKEGHVSQIIS